MNHRPTSTYSGGAACLCIVVRPPGTFWVILAKVNSLIAALLSRASGILSAAALTDWNLSWNGWKQKSSPGAGSHNGSWLGRTAEFGKRLPLCENLEHSPPKYGIHTSCLKVFYKASCWEETWRSDLGYFSGVFFLLLPCLWKVVCSISESTSCADRRRGAAGSTLIPMLGQHLGSAAGKSD